MKQAYIDKKNFHGKTKEILVKIIEIVEEYRQAGYRMTLRQLYYQLVARVIIENKLSEYSKLSRLLTDARLMGLIDWDFIEDRVRVSKMPSQWENISDLIDSAISAFRLERWNNQDYYVEVMVEKNALIGVLEPVCEEYHVRISPNVGYASTTVMHDISLRFRQAEKEGKKCILLYFGDHDPSGEDMVRDIKDRLAMFYTTVEVKKIALTMEQIQQYNLPPNPAKHSDPRSENYIAEHGESSWELDALPPNILTNMVTSSIREYIDMEKYEEVKQREEELKQRLIEFGEQLESEEENNGGEE